MKAKDYIAKIKAAPKQDEAIAQCVIDLMKEISAIAQSRHMSPERIPLAKGATIIKELNKKWYSIHRRLDLPPGIHNLFIEACFRKWPNMRSFF